MTSWLDTRTHRLWLDAELRRLLGFGRHVARASGGANFLGLDGSPDTESPPSTPSSTSVSAWSPTVASIPT